MSVALIDSVSMVVAAFALDDYVVYECRRALPGMILPFPFLHLITKAVSKNITKLSPLVHRVS